MTMANTTSGFRVTGIYPFNRDVVLDKSTLSNDTGLFLPMQSPFRHTKQAVSFPTEYTSEEQELFQTRYENGYDVTTDERYNCWLSQHHPDSQVKSLHYSGTAVSKYLSYPSPASRAVPVIPRPCGRVLTSAEHMVQLREKERMKEEKQRKKEEREEKRKEREKEKKEREALKLRKKKSTPSEHKKLLFNIHSVLHVTSSSTLTMGSNLIL